MCYLLCNLDVYLQFGQMFDRIDVTKQGVVNWDKFASHMLLEFYEKDDKVKSTQLPHWTELKVLSTSVTFFFIFIFTL